MSVKVQTCVPRRSNIGVFVGVDLGIVINAGNHHTRSPEYRRYPLDVEVLPSE
jgi:hypothetical protein